MSTVTITLPRLHDGQQAIKRERKRNNVICCGRRFGKNVLLQDLAVETGLLDHAPIGWGAPVYKQTLDDYKVLSNTLASVISRASVSELRLDIVGGGSIEFWSLDKPDSIRGKKYKRFIVNEAGMIPKLMEIRDFILTPTLIDLQGDSYYAGTPKGMNGFFKLYNIDGDEWARWQMSSYTNPHIPAHELDSLKLTMTERAFQQEILAQFIEDGAGVFRGVLDCATLKAEPPRKEGQYVIGADWGRTEDATVFIVLEVGTNKIRRMDRMLDTDYASQRQRLKVLSSSYNNAIVLAEANSIGQPNIEALQLMGVPVQGFMTTNASKAEIIQSLELAFERKQIEILNDDILTNELMAYTSEKLPSGLVRYNAPEGMHDDCVIALALAWWAGNGLQTWTSY